MSNKSTVEREDMRHVVYMKNVNSLKVVDDIVEKSREWGYGDSVELNLSKTRKYFPNHSTLLSAVLDYYRCSKDIDFSFSGQKGYGESARVGSYYNLNEIEKFNKFSDRVIKFENPTDALQITNLFIDEIIERVVCQEGVIDTFQWCIYEILDNVFEHSKSDSGFVMMQIHPRKKQCVIAVADTGRGIHRAMVDAEDGSSVDVEKIYRADVAIAHALEQGVTSKGKHNQGNGLHGLRASVEKNGGALMIQSGRGNWSYRNGKTEINFMKNRKIIDPENSHTTLVDWRLNCHNPVNISEVISSKFTSRNILEKYEGDQDYVEFDIKELEPASGSRQLSRSLRIKVENLINSGAEHIVFNFKGVGVFSSSFADELFGKLAVKLGVKRYKKTIFHQNATRTQEMLIEVATERRLSTGI